MEGNRDLIVIDLDEKARRALPHNQLENAGWRIHHAPDADEAGRLLQHHPAHVGLVNLGRANDTLYPRAEALLQIDPGMEWTALLEAEALSAPGVPELIRRGFFDFHTLPADPDRLAVTLGHAWGMARLRTPLPDEGDGEYEMVGTSEPMQALFRTIRKVAGADAPALIGGESGTGKELAALAIHERSPRAKGPFIAVNCGALPANLIQSELFGHEKGAFTGAHQRKVGRFEAAAGGTIFLDEIGDLAPELQVHLLRFLQEHTIERLGGTETLPLDVRVIAATHVNLEQAVAEGRFREDLYYRLNVLRLDVPPLRDRGADIELLARFFFNKFAREGGSGLEGFSRSALTVMRSHPWPGNIRELINRIRQAMVLCENRLITPEDLGLDRRCHPRQLETLQQVRARAERDAVHNALHHCGHNVSQAATSLGVSRVTLYRLMERHGLQP